MATHRTLFHLASTLFDSPGGRAQGSLNLVKSEYSPTASQLQGSQPQPLSQPQATVQPQYCGAPTPPGTLDSDQSVVMMAVPISIQHIVRTYTIAEAQLNQIASECTQRADAIAKRIAEVHDRQIAVLTPDDDPGRRSLRGLVRVQTDLQDCEMHVTQLRGLTNQESDLLMFQSECESIAVDANKLLDDGMQRVDASFEEFSSLIRNVKRQYLDSITSAASSVRATKDDSHERLKRLAAEKVEVSRNAVSRLQRMQDRLHTIGHQRLMESESIDVQMEHIDDYDPKIETLDRRKMEIQKEMGELRGHMERIDMLKADVTTLLGGEGESVQVLGHEWLNTLQTESAKQQNMTFRPSGQLPGTAPLVEFAAPAVNSFASRRSQRVRPRDSAPNSPLSSTTVVEPPGRAQAAVDASSISNSPLNNKKHRRGFLGFLASVVRRAVYDDLEDDDDVAPAEEQLEPPPEVVEDILSAPMTSNEYFIERKRQRLEVAMPAVPISGVKTDLPDSDEEVMFLGSRTMSGTFTQF